MTAPALDAGKADHGPVPAHEAAASEHSPAPVDHGLGLGPIVDFSTLPVTGQWADKASDVGHTMNIKTASLAGLVDFSHDLFSAAPTPAAKPDGEPRPGHAGESPDAAPHDTFAHVSVAEVMHSIAHEADAVAHAH